MHANVRALTSSGDRLDRVLLFAFDTDDAFLRAGGRHGELHTTHEFHSMLLHDDCILVQQRLAFRAIGDDRVRLGRQFDVRRETAATGAYTPACFTFSARLISFRVKTSPLHIKDKKSSVSSARARRGRGCVRCRPCGSGR
jgi:hypothetical protein